GNVADEKNRSVGFLGKLYQLCRTLPDLRNGTGSRVDQLGVQGLYRIHNHHLRLGKFYLLKNFLGTGGGKYITLLVLNANPLSPKLYLLLAFFTTYIKAFPVEPQGDLQHEGTLTDTRLTANECN